MARGKSILAKVLSLASFVTILIVIFAGTQCGGALDDIYMILLDVTKLKTNSTLSSEGKPYAADIGTYDFYTIHVLNYCAGFYDSHGGRNTTICTKTTLPFGFDTSSALLQDLGCNSTVGQQAIDWPYAVISDFVWISSISKAVSILSVLNIIAMGIVILIDGLLCSPGRNCELYTCLSRAFSMVSLLIMIITAIIATFCAVGFVELLNMHGDLYDITIEDGHLFLALIWVAVALCFLRNLPFLATVRIYFVKCEKKPEDDCEGIRLLDSQQSVGWWVVKSKGGYQPQNCRPQNC